MRVALLSILIVSIVIGFAFINCTAAIDSSSLQGVVVTLLPQVEFVKAIVGNKSDVVSIVPPGANPHVYEPTPSQITNIAKASMYAKVGSGIEFELAWMDKLAAANKRMLLIDCSKDISLIRLTEEGKAHPGDYDPHIWMSPPNAKIMVKNIYDGVVQLNQEQRAIYKSNLDTYTQKLDLLDREIHSLLSSINRRYFIVYHPTFAYFARDYNLNMIAIEEEGKEPSAADITRVIELAKKYAIKTVFASPQFNPQSAQIISREIGGKVVFIDHLSQNYVENMRNFTIELVKALK